MLESFKHSSRVFDTGLNKSPSTSISSICRTFDTHSCAFHASSCFRCCVPPFGKQPGRALWQQGPLRSVGSQYGRTLQKGHRTQFSASLKLIRKTVSRRRSILVWAPIVSEGGIAFNLPSSDAEQATITANPTSFRLFAMPKKKLLLQS
jgi:hypothetical protein